MEQFNLIGIILMITSAFGGFLGLNAMQDNSNDAADEALSVLTPQTESNFHDDIISNADDVVSAVKAMRTGNENPADVMTLIQRKASNAQFDTEYTAEQRAINKEYKTFLDIAGIVVKDYVSNSNKLDSDVKAMNDQYIELHHPEGR